MPTAPKVIRAKRYKRQERGFSSTQRGYDWQWRIETAEWIRQQMLAGNLRCAICGKVLDGRRRDIHVDHKVPPSRMGAVGTPEYQKWHSDQTNWQLSCPRCNMQKQNR